MTERPAITAVTHSTDEARVTLHALVDPVASGILYWIVNRARKLPAAADGFNAFLREYVSGVVERWPPAAAKAA